MNRTLSCAPAEAMASPESPPSSSLHIGEVFDGVLHNAPAHLGVGTADVKPTILSLSQSAFIDINKQTRCQGTTCMQQ
jgi:hypothetical protein